jgi:hypothetical protein
VVSPPTRPRGLVAEARNAGRGPGGPCAGESTWGWAPIVCETRGASSIPRKEVIQPHLPVRLPCYDFVPIAGPTLGGCPHKG